MTRPLHPRWVALLLFGSGFCALVYQVAWQRAFRTLFGASTLATSAVLAIFMAGLGFGGVYLGRYAQRHPRPLLVYAILELIIAVTAALSPLLLALARIVYLGIGGSQTVGNAGATALRLVLATVVIGAPVLAMGGTLPAAVRAATGEGDLGRKTAALLYGVNTVGGVIGAIVPTFVLLERLGNRATLWVAAVLNLGLGALAFVLARRQPELGKTEAAPASDRGTRWVLGAAFVTGFVFLLAELVWYRMAAPILGGTTFTFGLVLAWALLGIGVGGLIYNVVGPAEVTPRHFAITCTLEAIALVVPFVLGDRLAVWAFELTRLGGSGFGYLVGGWSLVSSIIVVPAAIVAGYQFPALLALKGRGRDAIAFDVGQVYAANTLGAILGALLGGFVLVPAMMAPNAWRFAAIATALLGIAVATRDGWRTPRRLIAPGALASIAVIACFARGPTAVWRQDGIGAGRGTLDVSSTNGLIATSYDARRQLMFERDGVESALGVIANRDGLAFLTNGKVDGSAIGDAWTTLLLGGIVGILHPHPRNALVIGLGSGETAGVLGRDPLIEHVDVAELEPAVLEYARACRLANFDVLDNPKVTIHIGDARELVATTHRTYDLISSEPSNPYRAGVASLFSLELYRDARTALAPGGMFAQWLQGYEIDAQTLATATATLHQVFPHVSLWSLGIGDYMLLGSVDPIVIDVAHVKERLAIEPYRTALGRVAGMYDVEALVARHLAGDAFAEAATGAVSELNTDDRMVFEYRFARLMGHAQGVPITDIVAAAAAHDTERPTVSAAIDWERVGYLRFRPWQLEGSPLPKLPISQSVEPWLAMWRAGGAPTASDELARQMGIAPPMPPAPPHDLFERLSRLQLAAVQPSSGRATLETEATALATTGLDADIRWVRLAAAAADRRLPEIAALAGPAFEALRHDPWIRKGFVDRTLQLLLKLDDPGVNRAILVELATGPFAVYLHEPTRQLAIESLAARLGDWERCAAAFELAEPWPVWTEELLRLRVTCYGHTRPALAARAADDLATFEDNQSSALTQLLGGSAVR